jgi:hypothetical protein
MISEEITKVEDDAQREKKIFLFLLQMACNSMVSSSIGRCFSFSGGRKCFGMGGLGLSLEMGEVTVDWCIEDSRSLKPPWMCIHHRW